MKFKKYSEYSESDFLQLFFAAVTGFFLVASVCMPDRAELFSGWKLILTQPAKISTSYFWLGGYAATFFNIGVVGLYCLALFVYLGATANNVSTLAFILTLGFSSWGIHPLNMTPTVAGVWLYCFVTKEPLKNNVNAMLFSTGIAPLISELMTRYPVGEYQGFNVLGVAMAIGVGLLIGFTLPMGLPHSPKVHKGFDLYSAALPIGMTAFFLQAVLHKTMGVDLPAAPAADTLKIGSAMITNIFCIAMFGTAIAAGLMMGGSFGGYWKLIASKGYVGNLSGTKGNGLFLMNFGIFGLFILGYYNLIGVPFNGVTFGIIFCMLATCNSGSNPLNVLPIMIGYYFTSIVLGAVSPQLGGSFSGAINAQAIAVGLCFANGLSPVSGKYGWGWGIAAGAMHYLLVTSVPTLHGGYCLYNGGFTAALICILLVPVMEKFGKEIKPQ